MNLQQALEEIERNHIEIVRFEISDFYGISHCKGIPVRHFQEKVTKGIPFFFGHLSLDPQAAIVSGTGYSEEVGYSDCIYHADLRTFRTVPWAPETARILTYPSYKGELVSGYPRNIAERLIKELKEEGFSLYSSHEHEFFVVDAVTKEPITGGVQVRATIRLAKHQPFLSQVYKQLPRVGVDLESIETEYAPGQYEISYKPAFGVKAADNAFTYKNGIKEIAQGHGFLASFTTKPFSEQVAASAHFNHSLWDADETKNLMYDASSQTGLSGVAEQWMAGILYHAPALTVLMSPTVNCLKRIEVHGFAPKNATWGIDNRTVALRVKVGGNDDTYVENRMGSSGGCPYISLAATVAAGLDGIRNKYTLPPPVNGIAYEDANVPPKTANLPVNMESALEALLADQVICKAMGKDFIKCFVALKNNEVKLETAARETGIDHYEWARSFFFEYV